MIDSMKIDKKGKVLIIEDEGKISDVVKSYLCRDGYEAIVASNGSDGLSLLKDQPDLIILDLKLPDIGGEEICESIRRDSDIPILMLTAKSAEEDKIKGLELGADDYVVKPFSPKEVVARVNALFRRTLHKEDIASFNKGALKVDRSAVKVFTDGKEIELTSTEFRILIALTCRPGTVISRSKLVNIVLGYDFEGYERTVDAHIKNLRQKIDPDTKNPRFIKTVYGMGYRFIGVPDEDK
jgi:two-component system OmpR family response regulator